MEWKNRIVGFGEADPTRLNKNPLNWRKHPEIQMEALSGILDDVGWVGQILINKTTGNVVDGHARIDIAIRRKEQAVPVQYVELTEEEEKVVLATFDPIGEMATKNNKSLAELLDGIAASSGSLKELLERLGKNDTGVDIEGTDETEEELYVQPGDIWILGKHRILCGDATSKASVEQLLGEDKPLLMVTDPPYGVNYDPDWRNRAYRANGNPYGGRAVGLVENDDKADWADAYSLFPGDVVYCWHPPGAKSIDFGRSLESAGFQLRMQIIWSKNHIVIGRGHYHLQHEPCWYAVRKSSSAHWTGSRKESTVWNIDKPVKSETGHSTQKPVECMEIPIRNHEGDVYDPFVGSGTTLIAAERQKRRCYAIEINPRYCQIAINRWEHFTGQKAKRDLNGTQA